MSCLSRLVGTAVLGAAAVGGWWWYSGGNVPLPSSITSRIPFEPRRIDSMSTAPARGLATARWQPIEDAAFSSAQTRLMRLGQRGGPPTVTLEAGELASFLVQPFARQLPSSAQGAVVAVVDDMVYVKSQVALADFGGSAILGPLTGALDRRDTIIIGGTFDLIAPGHAQFRIREVVVGEFSVPRPLVPKLIHATRRGIVDDGFSDDGYPVELPPYVGDVRISRGQITVYRVEPR